MSSSESDDIERLYRLRWYFRYPIAFAIAGVGIWLAVTMLEGGRGEWLAYGIGGCALLFAASLAWELSLLGLAVAAVWWITTWSKEAQIIWAVICLFSYFGHLFDKSANKTNDRINHLQRQIDELSRYRNR